MEGKTTLERVYPIILCPKFLVGSLWIVKVSSGLVIIFD
jgi:hypothetical protein